MNTVSKEKKRGLFLFWAILALLSLAAVILILWATPWGAGLSDDSYYYIRPARDVLAGLPFDMNPHWPPFLSLVLIGVGQFGIDPLNGIRYLNALLFGINVVLAAICVRQVNGSMGFSLLAGALVLSSESILEAHAWAMSEPLYFFLALSSILLLAVFFNRQSWPWLVVASLFAGLGLLTRYAGFTLAGTGVLAVILYTRGSPLKRFGLGLGFGLLAILPIAVYALHNLSLTGQPVGYTGFNWTPFDKAEALQALYTVLLWFMPGVLARGREILLAVLLLLIAGAVVVAYWRTHLVQARVVVHKFIHHPLMGMFFIFSIANLVLLYLARGFNSPFDSRLLTPVLFSLLILLCSLFGLAWEFSGRTVKAVATIFWAIFLVFYLVRSWDTVKDFHENGRGYASRYWFQSETVEYLNQHPQMQVISSAPFGVYFYTGKPTSSLYKQSISDVKQFLQQPDTLLIVFSGMPPEIYGISSTDLVQGLVLVAEMPDANIYRLR